MAKAKMETRNEILNRRMGGYAKAGRKEKSLTLTELEKSTGLSRNHIGFLLRKMERLPERLPLGKKDGKGRPEKRKGKKRGRKRKYGNEMLPYLKRLWELLGFSCSKRMKEGIENMLHALERCGELRRLDKDIKKKLLSISPSTIDRLMKAKRTKGAGKGMSTTKPGTLLKRDIPVRTGTDWDEGKPGFLEIDLVAHCGRNGGGEFVFSLDATDIFTGWTEVRAVTRKNQETVFKALMDIKRSLPFPLLGIDSDNGSEFINGHLFRYCKKEGIAFTRSRPYNKNDGCHVEEKNWSRVRRNVGYDRFEGKEAALALNRYYSLLCDYFNYFIPSMKLESKERKGKKTLRKHEIPKIPIDKVLGCAESRGAPLRGRGGKDALQKKRLSLNPVAMMKEMKELKERIDKIAIPYGRS